MKPPLYTYRVIIQVAQVAPAILAAVLCGCKISAPRPEPPRPAPPPAAASPRVVETESAAPEVAVVIELMEQGRGSEAADRLREILDRDAGTPGARGLLLQIERDPRELFGRNYRERVVQPGDTLAGLARTHLGDPLLFFALARYNGIPVPRVLSVGQVLKIPVPVNTPQHAVIDSGEQVEPDHGRDVDGMESGEAGDIVESTAMAVPSVGEPSRFQQLLVEQYHDHALRAWRDRKVGEAISLWEELLAIDPDFQPARVYLRRAYELQQRLAEMDENTAMDH